jgi:hypothetical protein
VLSVAVFRSEHDANVPPVRSALPAQGVIGVDDAVPLKAVHAFATAKR